MTIQWLLIVVTASRLYIPVMAYDTQSECSEAMAAVDKTPSVSLDCVLVAIKSLPTPRRRKKSMLSCHNRKKHAFMLRMEKACFHILRF